MEQTSFDSAEHICGPADDDRQESEALHQDQPNPEPADISKIKDLPKELGVMLVTAGIVGFILPGPGIPAIVAGGLVLWPKGFGKLESWLERAHPKVHREGMQQINRFLSDLQKRYPDAPNG
jgi:hypothetical protein